MLDLTLEQERALQRLFQLRKMHNRVSTEMQPRPDTEITHAVMGATNELRDLATAAAPMITGTLKSSHRAIFTAAPVEGYVILDSSYTNPVFGGRPVDYGPKVHAGTGWASRAKPWMQTTVDAHGAFVIHRHGAELKAFVDYVYGG